MPDQADIEQGLASLGAGALRDDPAEVRVYRGWPRAASLEADLQSGVGAFVDYTGWGGPGCDAVSDGVAGPRAGADADGRN